MKNKIGFGIMALLMALMLAAPVYATGGGGGAPDPEPAAGGVEIAGYTVLKSDGAVNTGSILKGDSVTVVVSLLDTRIKGVAATPVAALNTASFSLWDANSIAQAGTVAAGADGLRFSVTFRGAVYTGTGNSFEFTVSYADAAVPMASLSFALNQATPPVEAAKPPEVTVKGTGFVLKGASYGEGAVYAGAAFTLSATILATNGDSAVENVAVTFTPPEDLALADGSSVAYIGTMAPGASVPVNVSLMPSANIKDGSYAIAIDVAGVNQKTGEAVSAQMKVSVPVWQPERFEIFKTQLPSDLSVGMDDGMGYASITLVNQGKGTVSNVSVDIIGDGLSSDEGPQYIGNVGAGEQKSADFNLHADAAGTINALVTVAYENVRGEKKTLDHAFTISANEMAPPDMGSIGGGEMIDGGGIGMGEDGASVGMPKWAWIIIGAAVAAAAVAIIVRVRKKRLAAKEAELDDGDDDDE